MTAVAQEPLLISADIPNDQVMADIEACQYSPVRRLPCDAIGCLWQRGECSINSHATAGHYVHHHVHNAHSQTEGAVWSSVDSSSVVMGYIWHLKRATKQSAWHDSAALRKAVKYRSTMEQFMHWNYLEMHC